MHRISFDTNIIIAILTNNASGHRADEEWKGIRELTADIDRGKTQLILPTVLFSELLPSHYELETIDKLEQFLRRKNCELHDLTYRIARRSAELRDKGKLGSGRSLKTVDSIYIATAEIAGATELYSCDSDIYNATGASIRLLRPKSSRMSLFPADPSLESWQRFI